MGRNSRQVMARNDDVPMTQGNSDVNIIHSFCNRLHAPACGGDRRFDQRVGAQARHALAPLTLEADRRTQPSRDREIESRLKNKRHQSELHMHARAED